MKTFIVTVIDRARKRHRYPKVAGSWYECWLEAINEFGLVALISVRPFK